MSHSTRIFKGLFSISNCANTSRLSHSIPGLYHDTGPVIDPMVVNNLTESIFTYTPALDSNDQVYMMEEPEFTFIPSVTGSDQVYMTNEPDYGEVPLSSVSTTPISLINLV